MPRPRIKSADEELPKRPKQRELPGVEKPVIQEIEVAADYYVNVRDRRMALTEKEVEAQAVLLAKMKEHRLKSYRYGERIVSVVPQEKVKVKSVEPDNVEVRGNDQ